MKKFLEIIKDAAMFTYILMIEIAAIMFITEGIRIRKEEPIFAAFVILMGAIIMLIITLFVESVIKNRK